VRLLKLSFKTNVTALLVPPLPVLRDSAAGGGWVTVALARTLHWSTEGGEGAAVWLPGWTRSSELPCAATDSVWFGNQLFML